MSKIKICDSVDNETLHPIIGSEVYVKVIIPIAVPKPYTYYVPLEMVEMVKTGMRVEVAFGKKKRYAALVLEVSTVPPKDYAAKAILSVIDPAPIVTEEQLRFWQWLSAYYSCTIGEVMSAALPAGLRLASETKITLSPLYDGNLAELSDKEYLIAEALELQQEISLDDVRKILQQKTVYPLIHKMLERKIIYLKEELKSSYKPKKVICIRLHEQYQKDPNSLVHAFDLVQRSQRQTEVLLAFIQESKQNPHVKRQIICKRTGTDTGVIKAMVKKEIFVEYEQEVSRLKTYDDDTSDAQPLSEQQTRALIELRAHFQHKATTLLHGVTGSGKTRIYIELIKETLAKGGQVLYLLPEIGLTAQITSRLQQIFGDDIIVYHSRLNNNERVEMWKAVLDKKPIVLGARSSLLMPFRNLQLIIVDEEHDPSFKQYDPAPRYHARDSAIYLAHLHQAKVILGTATPSLESFYNAQQGKYALVKMPERFGGIQLPEIQLVDAKMEYKKKTLVGSFTSVLIEEIKVTLAQQQQVILFQNRRGYAPTLSCTICDWRAICINCDVSMTYHKFKDQLRCHYCGYQAREPEACPACGSAELRQSGFGTERIEEDLQIQLPEARIARMDFDTVKGKYAHARLISEFEDGNLDVLIGTQMVTKGLDFERVGLVGILSADQLLQWPDFRAAERAFQLMTQVAGRAGRKHQRGKVLIQAFNTSHPILQEVIDNNYISFYQREISERKAFNYPPFLRLIKITLKHKKPEVVNEAAKIMDRILRQSMGERVNGPAVPGIARINTLYLIDFLIKLENKPALLNQAKKIIQVAVTVLKKTKGFSAVRVNVDIDPN